MIENFYHLPLCFFLHSVVRFHLLGKVNLRAAAEMAGKGKPFPGLGAGPQASLLSIMPELPSKSSSCHLQQSAQNKKCFHSILHDTPQHLSGTQKVQFCSNTRQEL